MAFPPPVRVSPSGPLATNRLPDPFGQAAGNAYRAATTAAIILELGDAASGEGTRSLYAGDGITTIPAGNVRLPSIIPEVELDAGTYLVEVNLHVGFFTSPPETNTAGGLNVSAQFVDSGGVLIGTAAQIINSPLPIQYANGEDDVGVSAGKAGGYVLPLTLTPALVEQVAGVRVQIARATIPGVGPGGTYDDSAGTLAITRETAITVRRVR